MNGGSGVQTFEAAGLDLAAQLADPATVALLRASLDVGPIEFRAAGVSMRPLLRPGDTVRVERRSLQRGDVALAVVERRLVLHRLVRRGTPGWLLRGDARSRPDGWIREEDVLGVITARRARPGERMPWRRLNGAGMRWLGLAWSGLSPATRRLAQRLRRARVIPGVRPAGSTRAAAPPPAEG